VKTARQMKLRLTRDPEGAPENSDSKLLDNDPQTKVGPGFSLVQ